MDNYPVTQKKNSMSGQQAELAATPAVVRRRAAFFFFFFFFLGYRIVVHSYQARKPSMTPDEPEQHMQPQSTFTKTG